MLVGAAAHAWRNSSFRPMAVGAGHLANELAGYEETGKEDVVYLDEEPTGTVERDCYRPPVLVKGREAGIWGPGFAGAPSHTDEALKARDAAPAGSIGATHVALVSGSRSK